MLGMDKGLTKEVVAGHGVNIVPGILLHKDSKYDVEGIVGELGEALFVKPNKAGSSVGISKVASKEGLVDAIKKAFRYDNQVIVEKEIRGRELTVAIVEDENGKNILPIIEITANLSDWYDYKSKYESGGSDHICPVNISREIEEKAKKYASKAFESVGCRDLARVDILYDEEDGEVYFLEINTIPGMTSMSLVPDAAREVGISFEKLINDLIENNL
jgi:D-alanine-D-alanine ligase